MQAEELVKGQSAQADLIAKKLEEKLSNVSSSASSSELEKQLTGSLKQLKTDLKELIVKSSGGGGLSEIDRTFLKELTNETRDVIQDMRLEVLTASDKSKFTTLSVNISQRKYF